MNTYNKSPDVELFQLPNVHYEINSDYEFEELNESLFISLVFKELMKIMRQQFFDFDFFIFSNHKKVAFPESIHFKSDKKKVLFYFSDESGKDPSSYASEYFAIFKGYIGEKVKQKNVFPIQIGYVKDVPDFSPSKPILQRSNNVFFRGNLNKNRIDFLRNFSPLKKLMPSQRIISGEYYRDLLIKINDDFSNYFSNSIIIFNNAFKSGYSPEEYGRIIVDSKIVLCPKGYDMTECFRHFEAMRAGCVIISERLPSTDFYNGSPIIEVDNWKQGLKEARELLNNPQLLEKTHLAIKDWWENKCSERATASYINEKINHLLNPSNEK